jgi:hypothetical protein
VSEPIALVSSVHITPDELIAFAREVGATVTPNDPFLARLSRQDRHVWIAISDEAYDEATLEDYTQALGAPPAAIVVLEVSWTQGSMDLAAEFIAQFAQRWPAVVDTLRGWNAPVYSVDTFLDLYKKGLDPTHPHTS